MSIVNFIQNRKNSRRSRLVLTRRISEKIIIGIGEESIIITIERINGKQVVLGIEAEENTPVNRSEIYERIMRKNGLFNE